MGSPTGARSPPTGRGVVAFYGYFKTARAWAALIALVNLLGIAYGFYYYAPQFAKTPWYLWVFVPDSPLAVLWAELALVAYWLGRKPGVLDALAFVGNVQVGLWTVYVLLAYADAFGTYTVNLNTILLAGHAGMAVLGLIFLQGLRERFRIQPMAVVVAIGLAATYYLVQDALDYFGPDHLGRGCGMRPHTVPCDATMEPILTLVTFGLTAASVLALLFVVRRRSA